MFLGGDDGATFASGTEDGLRIQRLHRVMAQDAAVQAAFSELTGGEETMHDGFAGGDESDILALAQGDGFAGLEFRFGQV